MSFHVVPFLPRSELLAHLQDPKIGPSLELEGSKRALAGKGSKKSTGKKPSFRLVNDDNLPQI